DHAGDDQARLPRRPVRVRLHRAHAGHRRALLRRARSGVRPDPGVSGGPLDRRPAGRPRAPRPISSTELIVASRRPMRSIRIGSRLLGEGQPCFIAAEAGINHNGDLAVARRLIDAAAEAGADAVKFQNYSTDDFLSADKSLQYEYVSQGK